jgi:hypothetical protein
MKEEGDDSGLHTSVTYREMKVEGQFCPYENTVIPYTPAVGPRPLWMYTAYLKGR